MSEDFNAPASLPMQTRAAPIGREAIDTEARTVNVVFTTGAAVRRRRWTGWDTSVPFDEVLEVSRSAVNLTRLNAGAPALDSHSTWSSHSQVGVIERAWIDGNEGKATIRFPAAGTDAAADRMWGLVSQGIIRNVSVGYTLDKVRVVDPEKKDEVERRIVERWTPHEISFVTVPADPGAQVRSDSDQYPVEIVNLRTMEADMTARANEAEVTSAAPVPPNAPEARVAEVDTRSAPELDVAAITEASERAARDAAATAVRAERDRVDAIRKLADQFKRAPEVAAVADEAIRSGSALDEVRVKIMDAVARWSEALPQVDGNVRVDLGAEHHEKRSALIGEALRHRANPAAELSEGAREYRGFTLIDMARESLELRGEKTRGMAREEIAAKALAQRSGGYGTTSDFPVILGNVVNSTLRAAYETAPQTFRPLVREVSVSDFKSVNRAQLGEGPAFDKVNEHGEFKRGSIAEGKETYKVATFGKVIAITRQVIINDDMNAFGRIPQLLGGAAAQLESDLVWYQILSNPVMGDGTALFHANHKNLPTAAAFDVGPLGTARALMAKQVGLDGKTVLNIRPQYLIVPVELETTAEQKLKTLFYPSASANAATASMRALEIISEPRLDNGISNPAVGANVAGSATAWYLAASPSMIDVVELAYLEGNRGVYTETRYGFDVDGVEVKGRLDVGAKAIDHRGLLKNAGQ